ncbi:MAG: DUF4129 domain-containing protein, partial [Desulfatitalea sp.]|nr:DUF4129 domain-containing protein [Desulfatitalea sp.]NNK00931.1 DUF4129 domain-containing protein [Desulfatitalea sp.]
ERADEPEAEKTGWLWHALRWVKRQVKAVVEAIESWLHALEQWLKRVFPQSELAPESRTDWRPVIRIAFYGIGAILVLLVLLIIRRRLLYQMAVKERLASVKAVPVVDINDENISAADLPRDRWMGLAWELMARQDLRQALRAFYLALLAHLGDHGRVVIARHKSNREYLAELNRRSHVEPDLPRLFDQCMAAFERTWYGMHPVARDQLDQFIANQERISALVRSAA